MAGSSLQVPTPSAIVFSAAITRGAKASPMACAVARLAGLARSARDSTRNGWLSVMTALIALTRPAQSPCEAANAAASCS